MAKKPEGNIDYLSDPEIYDAIRYLEPDPICRNSQKEDTAFVICVAVIILLLGCLGFVWLWWR